MILVSYMLTIVLIFALNVTLFYYLSLLKESYFLTYFLPINFSIFVFNYFKNISICLLS
jgi:hypothetical protein